MRNTYRQASIVLICLFALWLSGPTLFAASPKVTPQENSGQRLVNIDFNDVDINTFIKAISDLTRKNFIVDRDVKGKVTIVSPAPISETDAYRVFESVLEVYGYAAVPSGSVTKIIPSTTARSKSVEILRDGRGTSEADTVVTQIVALKNASAEEVRNVLTPLGSKTSVITAHAGSGILILTDFQSNISRLMEIIRAVDVPTETDEMAVIQLHRTSAEGVAKAMNQLYSGSPTRTRKGVQAETAKVIPFERTNAVIVMTSKAFMPRMRELIAKLDEDSARKSGNIRVIYLQHAHAEELVKVLMNLPGESSGSKSGSSMSGSGSSAAGGGSPTGPAISKEVKVVADKETNALIVTGPLEEYETVEEVVKKLDIPRRMVYLEALIMEVKVSKDFAIGVQWADVNGSVVAGFSGTSDSAYANLKNATSTTGGSLPAGFTLGVLEKGVTIGNVTFPNLGAVVNAYKSDSDVNVIATPQILTTDNKKATIKVGENVPYITSKNTTSGTQQDYTNYEYKDVATSLTITPQVNQAEVVRLDIGVEVIKLKSTAATTTPTTYTRTADTTVVVHNEQTVVIGGMIGQDTTASDYKVPVLGDIPLLGWMFKTHGKLDEKTNLYIFITPHIVASPAELADLYQKKRDVMEKVHKKPGDIADQFLHPAADPKRSVALTDIGFSKLERGDLAGARDYFEQALKIDPNNSAALINLATVCEREGKLAEAEKLYRRVLDIPPPKRAPGKNAGAPPPEDPLRAVAKAGLQRLQASRGGTR